VLLGGKEAAESEDGSSSSAGAAGAAGESKSGGGESKEGKGDGKEEDAAASNRSVVCLDWNVRALSAGWQLCLHCTWHALMSISFCWEPRLLVLCCARCRLLDFSVQGLESRHGLL
jgi:hypothetical protein